MTTQEIKDLVAAKIAGQGNQVDLGNAISGIFNSLCDLIDNSSIYVVPEEVQESDLPAIMAAKEIRYKGQSYYPTAFAAIAAKYQNPNFGKENEENFNRQIGVWQSSDLLLDVDGNISTGSILVLQEEHNAEGTMMNYKFRVLS